MTTDEQAPRPRRPQWSSLRDTIVITIISLASVAILFGGVYSLVDSAVRRWADRDLARRSQLIWFAVRAHDTTATDAQMQRTAHSIALDDRVAGILICGADGEKVATSGIDAIGCRSQTAAAALANEGHIVRAVAGRQEVGVTAHTLSGGRHLLVVQDRAFIAVRRQQVLRILFVATAVAALAAFLLARAGARFGSRRTNDAARDVIRSMRSGGTAAVPSELRLLVRDVRETVDEIRRERSSASMSDGAAKLRDFVNTQFPDSPLVVIANREPYSHEFSGSGGIIVERPPSGLVTAIEPILRACGGTWIAYASGSADHVFTDSSGRVAVPPDSPEYVLRRLAIDRDRYERYYSGFANEGLWPLCHIAHTRPSFRAEDWSAYESVNDAFAKAAVEEAGDDGIVLVQDYHFALVPRMLREKNPNAITSLFWHIPWPNSEVIGICPWKEALLDGMLGADVLGFHTRYHCLNFLETVNRYAECRTDLESMSVESRGHRTLVRPYPISVEWPYPAASRRDGAALRRSLGIPADVHVSIGVDRADYTKGLLERIAAVEALLDEEPELAGRYVLVQLAAPTRTSIRKYRDLASDVEEAVQRVNNRFGTSTWKPVILEMRSFSPEDVRLHYAMANSALVTPLHDGMNLVAKEYVAACQDGDGVLILSVFAGAAKELEGALLVNPYDSGEMARAIARAVKMPAGERRARMRVMREQIASNSIYDWSRRLLSDMRDVQRRRNRYWPARTAAATKHRTEIAR